MQCQYKSLSNNIRNVIYQSSVHLYKGFTKNDMPHLQTTSSTLRCTNFTPSFDMTFLRHTKIHLQFRLRHNFNVELIQMTMSTDRILPPVPDQSQNLKAYAHKDTKVSGNIPKSTYVCECPGLRAHDKFSFILTAFKLSDVVENANLLHLWYAQFPVFSETS